MRPRARLATAVAATLVAVGALSPAPAAAGRTEAVVDVGRTLGVSGEPGNGGVSLALSLLWPLEGRFRAGIMAFADALGDRTGRLIAPGGVDLGPVATDHRAAWGGAMRLEGHARRGSALEPLLAATWGVYRVGDDVRGTSLGKDYAAGIGLGLGLLHTFNDHHAAGLVLRGQRLSRGAADTWASAALEWRWGMGGEQAPAPPPAGIGK